MNSASEIQIFRNPRPKKILLPPHLKKRKVSHKIEEITFDFSSREEYLTGFHKRKVARAKLAQAENAKKLREERLLARKKLREDRKKELEIHVEAMNATFRDLNSQVEENNAESGSDDSECSALVTNWVDHEDEYVDEHKFTSVTVEAVDISKEGLSKIDEPDKGRGIKKASSAVDDSKVDQKMKWPKKTKKKFHYESKLERKLSRAKQKAGKKRQADARKSNL